MPKKIALHDFETGVEFERQLAIARTQLDTLTQSYLIFLRNLRARHNAPEEQFDLVDFAEGFVPIVRDDADLHND